MLFFELSTDLYDATKSIHSENFLLEKSFICPGALMIMLIFNLFHFFIVSVELVMRYRYRPPVQKKNTV